MKGRYVGCVAEKEAPANISARRHQTASFMTVHPGPRATLSVLKRNTLATTIMLALLSLTTALVLKPSEAPLPALRLRGGKRLAHARIASSHRTHALTAPTTH